MKAKVTKRKKRLNSTTGQKKRDRSKRTAQAMLNHKTPFVIGNQIWRVRAKHGRDKIFSTPEILWEEAVRYFDWAEANPLYETKLMSVTTGRHTAISHEKVPHIRAMTMRGLCLFLGVSESYFREFKSSRDPEKHTDFMTIIGQIEYTVYLNKFEGAAAGMLNANIISRDLGLHDKLDVTSLGEKINPLPPQINVYNTAPPLAESEENIAG